MENVSVLVGRDLRGLQVSGFEDFSESLGGKNILHETEYSKTEEFSNLQVKLKMHDSIPLE